ncbi:hypothetical protein [Deinococcus aestuarii]|uniref:hypothetical protein n=1 Tax=Deinococcus aestuarii TaxID=2774531 RepID=UPI001C0C574A|nr:hypothetical protein [Deinococcus aestuarii]
MVKRLPTPRHSVYQPELATVAELEALDLKLGSIRTGAPPTYEDGDRSGRCGLNEIGGEFAGRQGATS